MTPVSTLLPMVRRIASRYRGRVWNACDREDLQQEAALGLLEAAARYETGRGVRLAFYGARRADGACLDQVRSLSRHGREIPVADVRPGPSGVAGQPGAGESPSPESRVMLARFRRFLEQGAPSLPPLEATVLRQRYREGLSMREAAQRLGISAPTVLRIERRALDALRTAFLDSEARARDGRRLAGAAVARPT